jgi:hypothetical protein
MDYFACLKSMGNGLQSRFFASQNCLDERETKDEVHSNAGAHCNKEGGDVAILSSIRKCISNPTLSSVVIGMEYSAFMILERMMAT